MIGSLLFGLTWIFAVNKLSNAVEKWTARQQLQAVSTVEVDCQSDCQSDCNDQYDYLFDDDSTPLENAEE